MRGVWWRTLVVVASLVACAWFVVGIRQAHETDAAGAVLGSGAGATGPSPAALRAAASSIDAAHFLYPGQNVALLRGQLLLSERRFDRAEVVIARVVRAEPQNLQGVVELSALFILAPSVARRSGFDPARLRERIAALDPIDARRL